MTYLIDTTVFSDLMRDHAGVRARLAELAPTDRVVICSIVRGEVAYGIGRLPAGRRRADLATKAAALFSAIRCEPVPPETGDQYAQVKRVLQQAGTSLDENDLWFAATALTFGATLVTRDSDFQRIGGLAVENWSA